MGDRMKLKELLERYDFDMKQGSDTRFFESRDVEVIAFAVVDCPMRIRKGYASTSHMVKSSAWFAIVRLNRTDFGKRRFEYIGIVNGMREPVVDVAIQIERIKIVKKDWNPADHPQLSREMMLHAL
jgi:hypothetical protein